MTRNILHTLSPTIIDSQEENSVKTQISHTLLESTYPVQNFHHDHNILNS